MDDLDDDNDGILDVEDEDDDGDGIVDGEVNNMPSISLFLCVFLKNFLKFC